MSEGFPETVAPAASLFESNLDRVVTIKGVTGPIGSLIRLCPVPESEMDPERKEQWTADILIEAGEDVSNMSMSEATAAYVESKKKDL
ncbi:MAG TPA: hypothetical protein VLG25_00245 [Patescibacteria group bacterium]|nr:hypothetical protein [Patescibacteria group bacterium]